MKMAIVFGLVFVALFRLPSWGQESAGQHCENGKLSTEVAELAQAVSRAPGDQLTMLHKVDNTAGAIQLAPPKVCRKTSVPDCKS